MPQAYLLQAYHHKACAREQGSFPPVTLSLATAVASTTADLVRSLAKSGSGQSACAERCRTRELLGRLWTANRVIKCVVCSLPLRPVSNCNISRWTVNYVPARRTRGNEFTCRAEACQADCRNTSFLKLGACAGRTFVCVIKPSPLSSMTNIFVPNG